MQTEEDGISVTSKKKNDKGQTSSENIVLSVDKNESKKSDKSDGEDPKPRIVLTFRSEKSGAKTSNMKIVPNDEKHEEFSPRRSSRTRNKWEWSDDAETSISPKKEKNSSQSVSENDEMSDGSHATPKRSTRRRSKDSSENVLANAIARKEKSYNETVPTQRLSRRIKPTAKILANEELRIGLESQNNARLGIQTEKSEEGVRTRRSARHVETGNTKLSVPEIKVEKNITIDKEDQDEEAESSCDSKTSQSVMKLKHLCELGLKAINPETLEDEETEDMEAEEDVEEEEDEELEEEEMDDDSEEVISKLLEADEDSSEDFSCTVDSSQTNRPRRSTRLISSYVEMDHEQYENEDLKEPRRSSRRSTRYSPYECDGDYRPPRKKNRSGRREETQTEGEQEDGNNSRRRNKSRVKDEEPSETEQEETLTAADPAGGDEGDEAACPEDESSIFATCLCDGPTNIYAAPESITEPVFCQAIETVDDVRVGCSHSAQRELDGQLTSLRRAGPRAPFFLSCRLHALQLQKHMCCPACGLFCTQGTFYQCSRGHLFHLDCGLPYNEVKARPGCPHCGVRSYRWTPVNCDCSRVRIEMRCSNKRIYLPDQREQCTQAYLSFSNVERSVDDALLIPEELLPATPLDAQTLRAAAARSAPAGASLEAAAQRLCDAILARQPVDQIVPLIESRSVVNEPLASLGGGAGAHAASRAAHAAALHALHCAGADLDAPDNGLHTPLMLALHLLFDKEDKKSNLKAKTLDDSTSKTESESQDSKEAEDKEDSKEIKEEKDDSISDEKKEDETNRPSDEDLIKVIRYLVAAGCDVNVQGPEGITALHIAAQHGSEEVCAHVLEAPGALVDPRDFGGWTPLVWAAENSHPGVVRLLLSRGADAATCDAEGNAAVHWCALAGEQRALRLLLDRAPQNAHSHNAHRDTPLHVAARQGHYACVVILLARGARTDVENSAGELPVDVCTGACQKIIALNMQILSQVGDPFKQLSSDISNGHETFPVPCVNEEDDEPLPTDFTYVTDHVLPEPLKIDYTLTTMQGCSCADGACAESSCGCSVLSVRRWYTAQGRLPSTFPHHDPPMLLECNQTCGCHKRKCCNMVVTRMKAQGSLGARVCVFRTRNKGWGLRTLAAVPRGTPVAVYCGELLALAQADTRVRDQYMFALDLKRDLLEQCIDKTLLCVDACRYGSAARFINHSCQPNLAPVRVFTNTRDLRRPDVVLFATTSLRAGDELTFDYGDKFWSVKSKWMKCECGTPECRYPEKVTVEEPEP